MLLLLSIHFTGSHNAYDTNTDDANVPLLALTVVNTMSLIFGLWGLYGIRKSDRLDFQIFVIPPIIAQL